MRRSPAPSSGVLRFCRSLRAAAADRSAAAPAAPAARNAGRKEAPARRRAPPSVAANPECMRPAPRRRTRPRTPAHGRTRRAGPDAVRPMPRAIFAAGREAHGVCPARLIGRAGRMRRSTLTKVNRQPVRDETGTRLPRCPVVRGKRWRLCHAAAPGTRVTAVRRAAACGPAGLGDDNPAPIKVGQAVICDTSEQAQRFVALRNGGSEAVQAFQVINREAANPSACGTAIVAFRSGEAIGSGRVEGQLVNVVKITVLAFNNGAAGRWSPRPCNTRSSCRTGSRCSCRKAVSIAATPARPETASCRKRR